MIEHFKMGEKNGNPAFQNPVIDKEECLYLAPTVDETGKVIGVKNHVTPDQYDKLMRRLIILEQKILMLGQQDYTAKEVDKLFEQNRILREQFNRIEETQRTVMQTLATLMKMIGRVIE